MKEHLTGVISLPPGAFKSIIYELLAAEGISREFTQLDAKAMVNCAYM